MKPDPLSNPAPQSNALANTSIVLSSLGLVGFLLVLALMLAMPYEPMTGNGVGDLFTGINNLLLFIVRAFVGVVGLAVNSTLSTIGVILGLLGTRQEPSKPAYYGLCIGVGGMTLGVAIFVWRMVALGLV